MVETVTGVADSALTHPEAYRPGHDYLASVTDDIVNRLLPNGRGQRKGHGEGYSSLGWGEVYAGLHCQGEPNHEGS